VLSRRLRTKGTFYTDEQDTKREASSIVISPEPFSCFSSLIEGSRFVENLLKLGSDNSAVSSSLHQRRRHRQRWVLRLAVRSHLRQRFVSPTTECSPNCIASCPPPANGIVQTMGRPGFDTPRIHLTWNSRSLLRHPRSPLKVTPGYTKGHVSSFTVKVD